ncbi:MAG: NAD(P)/FAD-dependent oxidoreductase, partial [Vulcanimicrobiaceae bacterium]
MDTHSDVIILGAGVIGLSLAFELAQQDLRVSVYDIGLAFSGASSAAGGMLVPWTEVHEPNALQELCTASFSMYPSFVSRLRPYGEVTLRLNGVLEIAHTAERLAQFEQRARALKAANIEAQMLR